MNRINLEPEAIAARLPKGELPPVHSWNPDVRRDIDMRIARDGSWYYNGSAILRPAMVRLFSTILRHDDDGRFYLVTPAEMLGISVDDAPFVAVEMTVHGNGEQQVLTFRTNVDDEIMAGPDNPIRVEIDGDSGEPEDAGVVDTALRETEEEIGLDRSFVEVVGFLDDYQTGTGFHIAPVVGFVRPGFALSPDSFEVAEVFEVPLDFLFDPANHQTHSRVWNGRERQYHAMPYQDYYIWGATAGMLMNLYRRVHAPDIDAKTPDSEGDAGR